MCTCKEIMPDLTQCKSGCLQTEVYMCVHGTLSYFSRMGVREVVRRDDTLKTPTPCVRGPWVTRSKCCVVSGCSPPCRRTAVEIATTHGTHPHDATAHTHASLRGRGGPYSTRTPYRIIRIQLYRCSYKAVNGHTYTGTYMYMYMYRTNWTLKLCSSCRVC